jgi:hypothetical protein
MNKLKVLLAASALLFGNISQAAIIDLTITGSWESTDYNVTSTLYGDDDLVFGTSPSDGSTSFTLRVDTSSAVAYSSGYLSNGTDALTHDWFGYSDVSLVGTHTLGTASWDTSGILSGLIGVDGLAKALWTNTDISSADPTLLSFRMFGEFPISSSDTGTADLFIGSRTSTTIGTQFLAWEYFAGEEIRSSSYSAVATNASVPEPSIIALFGLGLVGLGFARRRRQS